MATQLENLLQEEDIERLAYADIVDLFLNEKGIADYQPDHIAQGDPRNEEQVLFNTSRADRPHDNADQGMTSHGKIAGVSGLHHLFGATQPGSSILRT